jgi:hypothetical protein
MNFVQKAHWVKAARRCLEYAIAVGLAIFSGYCIVQGRW